MTEMYVCECVRKEKKGAVGDREIMVDEEMEGLGGGGGGGGGQ